MITKDNLQFTSVEKDGLRSLLKFLVPEFTIPSLWTFSRAINTRRVRRNYTKQIKIFKKFFLDGIYLNIKKWRFIIAIHVNIIFSLIKKR